MKLYMNKKCLGLLFVVLAGVFAANSKGESGEVPAIPTSDSMRALGHQAALGKTSAVDEIEGIYDQLYKDIDFRKEENRTIANLILMNAAFDEMAISIKGTDEKDPAFRSLMYATGKIKLAPFTSSAFGTAAARGHQPSLKVLLHHNEHGILLSSAVFALQKPAEKGNPKAIDFLVGVINNNSCKSLWHAASEGIVMAANQGNEGARKALAKYAEDEAKRR